MGIINYIREVREVAPYIKKAAIESAKDIAKGLALTGALFAGSLGITLGVANLPEPQYNVWQVRSSGDAVIVEKRGMFGYVRLVDKDGDGIVDAKSIVALPRPGCFGSFEPSELEQTIFDEVIHNNVAR